MSPDIDGQFAFSGVLSQNLIILLILHYCAVWFCDEINVLSPLLSLVSSLAVRLTVLFLHTANSVVILE